jgi:hypothetical protein
LRLQLCTVHGRVPRTVPPARKSRVAGRLHRASPHFEEAGRLQEFVAGGVERLPDEHACSQRTCPCLQAPQRRRMRQPARGPATTWGRPRQALRAWRCTPGSPATRACSSRWARRCAAAALTCCGSVTSRGTEPSAVSLCTWAGDRVTWGPGRWPCVEGIGLPLQVDVVVGFSNSGEEAYNVSAIQGSLHSAAQWNLWVQNFTVAVRFLAGQS